MPPRTIRIALFRNDLRLADNPMLHAAVNGADELVPLYCFDPRQLDLTPLNGRLELGKVDPARTWHYKFPRNQNMKAKFLVESVLDLQKDLRGIRSDLLVRFGAPDVVVSKLVKHLRTGQGAQDANVELFCQREQTYEETKVEEALRKTVHLTLTDGGSTLVHPEDAPFKPSYCPAVFTSFRKKVEGLRPMVRDLLPTPSSLPPLPSNAKDFLKSQDDPSLLESLADLKASSDERSTIPYAGGSSSALERLNHYCTPSGPLFTYKKTRNALSGRDGSSHFSPFLSVGALSARQIFWAVRAAEDKRDPPGGNEDSYWLIFELLWRDYWKFLARGPMDDDRMFALYGMQSAPGKKHEREKGKVHEWKQDEEMFENWKSGTTGVPFVDANMRELVTTGYMSNRGRQNVANFLTGQMCMDWRMGAEWFESCLVDHDVCSNYGNWTYVAGVGTDPRAGRNFNIMKQANDYDADGDYVKLWLPELKDVPREHVHHPWTWAEAGEKLGNYPSEPILHRQEWEKFLKNTKGGGGERTRGGGRGRGGRGRGRGRRGRGGRVGGTKNPRELNEQMQE
ncbi:cryptochrome [Exidia glandulosa HHB12029]|uniref:Cryptochrome DASH n=1 Tax=Exidia glandulosa HHB12029 TaxID=1314781 RepID=A0A165I3N7_EXIGL|nr:cryptochrome [Exidia glandulosa HHB12029]